MRSLRELMDLEGRVALITGGGGHLGSAMGDALAELGATIVVLDSAPDVCVQTATRIHETFSVETLPLVIDLADEAAVRSVPGRILDRLGRLDILVNCAALVGTSELKGWAVSFAEQRSDTWRRALEVNLTAPFVLVQACAEALARSRHGSVINIGSIYGIVGPDMSLYENTSLGLPAAYSATKAGLIQLSRWLATVLAPKVRVNSITLGGVWRNQPEAFHRRYVARTPLGRMATEEDIKGATAYLASDLSLYVTGENLVLDGGWTAW
ncbi:MAG: SDR family oxidoreductase [Candidatus Omnitrophica bacterium]|nr:SDR family oxidoreductase [Candidatus Omnitrophota bacterium]